MFKEQKRFGVLRGMKAFSFSFYLPKGSVQQIPALVPAEWLKEPNMMKHCLLQTQKDSVHQDSFDLPRVACCPFMGPEGKTKASLVFACLTQKDQDFFALFSLNFKQDVTRRLKNISGNSSGLKHDTEMKCINNVLYPEDRKRKQQCRARWKTAGLGLTKSQKYQT